MFLKKVIIKKKDERIIIYFRSLRMTTPYESSNVSLVALSSSLGYAPPRQNYIRDVPIISILNKIIVSP